MLVYGDAERRDDPACMLERIAAGLEAAGRAQGVERHGMLVGALIEAGELAQGIADHDFAGNGGLDDRSPASEAALALVRALARRVARSWDAAFSPAADPDDRVPGALARVRSVALPPEIRPKQPEGFAHYAVYPEGFLAAARRLPAGCSTFVVGIRSIGTTLAAAAAEGCASPSGVLTVRPKGHPFRRQVEVSPAVADSLSARADDVFAIVDEGPGLSGSSVVAAAGMLGEAGVAAERIHVLPSHPGGPGPEASPAVLAFWSRAPRHVVAFDDLVLRAPDRRHRLESWFADVVGPGELLDISGGAWRRHRPTPAAGPPPAHAWQERRKFLLRTAAGAFLLRFAGLGRIGAGKFAMARRLFAAGFVPEPLALRHGFLLERWLDGARPLPAVVDRTALVDRLGRYLGFRARSFPAGGCEGASVPALFAMLVHNAAAALGPDAAEAAEGWRPHLAPLDAARRPVLTDNRLHAWEWLVDGDRIIKADALDHHAGHDLVGPQDVAWDIAGASVEFALAADEEARLVAVVERDGGRAVDRRLLAFLRLCYPAFQLGYYATAGVGASDAAERARLDAAADRYRGALRSAMRSA